MTYNLDSEIMDDGTYAYDDRLISRRDKVLPAFYWPLHGE